LIETVKSMGSVPPEQWVERQLPLIFPLDWIAANPGVRDLLLLAVQSMPPTPAETANAAIGGLFGWSSYERLPEIHAPTLIVHGDQDVLIPVQNAHILAQRIPGARLHIVRGAGHGYPAQDPTGVHQTITDFLRTH
jgi:pimeloyl-ACP methyl ester carboxylesterase